MIHRFASASAGLVALASVLWSPGALATGLPLGDEPVFVDVERPVVMPGVIQLESVLCWEAALYDQDGDGYAEAFAPAAARETRLVPYAEQLTCDDGWVKLRGDCDDDDPEVRPRRDELPGNGLDDNCDGGVDEPTLRYGVAGHRVTTSGFGLEVTVNDTAVLETWRNRTTGRVAVPKRSLAYEVEYQTLSNTGVTLSTGRRTISGFFDFGAVGRVSLDLTGLAANTVYRARVQFYERATYGLLDLDTAVGDASAWFYSVTSHSSVRGQARRDVVLRGLYEAYVDEVYSDVGYRGDVDVDGTRYGAEEGEAWCSEFYAWVVGQTVTGMVDVSGYDDLIEYFEDAAAYTLVAAPTDYTGLAKHGDYLAEDTDLDGSLNHSAMFLAYDTHLGELWTLDGNSIGGKADGDDVFGDRSGGNEVTVRNRGADTVAGWGSLVVDML
jgi:hypothetical protein